MVDDDAPRPSLEAPKLFGRRRARPADDLPAFDDSGTDPSAETVAVPVVEAESVATPGLGTEPDETSVLPVTAPGRRERRVRRVRRVAGSDDGAVGGGIDVDDDDVAEVDDEPAPRIRRTSRDSSNPLLPGRPAAAVTGLLAGLALVGFTWLGFQGCEAARGTSSCGTGPGMAALIVVMALTIVTGALILRAFRIPEPGSTSFLGTGLTGVIYLIVLVDRLDGWSNLIVIPAISAATYLLSWWVTTTYVSDDD